MYDNEKEFRICPSHQHILFRARQRRFHPEITASPVVQQWAIPLTRHNNNLTPPQPQSEQFNLIIPHYSSTIPLLPAFLPFFALCSVPSISIARRLCWHTTHLKCRVPCSLKKPPYSCSNLFRVLHATLTFLVLSSAIWTSSACLVHGVCCRALGLIFLLGLAVLARSRWCSEQASSPDDSAVVPGENEGGLDAGS